MCDSTCDSPLKQCAVCLEWFPETTEFFQQKVPGRLDTRCKTCISLIRRKHLVPINPYKMAGYKKCASCHIYKPATHEYFTHQSDNHDGFHSWCRECRKLKAANYTPSMPAQIEKRCRDCGKVKPLREFHKYRLSKDGYRYSCKLCRSKVENFRYIESVPEGHKRCCRCNEVYSATTEFFPVDTRKLEGITGTCLKCMKVLQKQRRIDNHKEILEYQRAYRQSNREHVRAIHRKWSNAKRRKLGIQPKSPFENAPDGYKRCSICKSFFPNTEDYFYRNVNSNGGFTSHCKNCLAIRYGRVRRISAYFQVPDGYKRCSKCKQILPATPNAFSRNRTTSDGLTSECKTCESAQGRNYYIRNRETLIKRSIEWVNANKHKAAVIRHRRRAKIKEASQNSLTEAEWLYCLSWFNYECVVCGTKDNLTIDHWIALNDEHSPGHIASNIVPLCRSCNCSKQDTRVTQWLFQKFDNRIAFRIMKRVNDYFNNLQNQED